MPVVELAVDELRAVMQRVGPFAHPDEELAIGNVLLTAEQGRRVWYATDGYRLARLVGGACDDEVHVTLPRRVLVASPDSDADVILELPDGDDNQLTLCWGEFRMRAWTGPEDFPDVRATVEHTLDRPYVAVEVDARMAWHLLAQGRLAPWGVEVGEDIPDPLFWLHAEGGELRVEVDWERFGPVQLAIAARTDGRARVAVAPRFLADLLEHVGDADVTLQLPVRYGDPIWVADGDWSMYLMPVSPYPSLDSVRGQLEQLLRSGYRLDELVADDDGDYPFRVGDATMYVRLVDAAPPVVQVFAVVLRGVPVSAELLRELNDITAEVHHGRVFWVDGQVLAEAEIVASDLSFDELGAACRAVADILEDLRPLLLARFGEGHDPPWEAES
jgi:hypothetical protein